MAVAETDDNSFGVVALGPNRLLVELSVVGTEHAKRYHHNSDYDDYDPAVMPFVPGIVCYKDLQ